MAAVSEHESSSSPAGPPDRRRQLRRRFRLAVVAGLFLGPLLAIEGGVRWAWEDLADDVALREGRPLGRELQLRCQAFAVTSPGSTKPLRVPFALDARRRYRLLADSHARWSDVLGDHEIRSDQRGLRGPTRELQPAPVLRILAVGDSMTFGHGVGDLETWPARLEARLAEGGLSAQVFNAGLPDYGQAEEFVSLKEFLPVLTPDLVLLGFCVSNDVLNNLRCSEELPVRSEPNAFAQFIDHPLLTNPLARWSRAYRYGVWTYGRHWLRYELMHEPEALARTGRWLERLHAISRGADGRTIPMGLVLVPTVHQVSKTLSERIGRTVRVNDAVLSLCTELGLPALDPLAALRLETEPLYIPVDRHMNRAGNDALARAIVPFARELLELDATDQRR